MDTTQVPEFKLAKVGKRREKKRAGAFWLGGGGGGGFAGAVGGSGVLAFKAALLALLAVMCVGAYNVGSSMAPAKKGALQKPKTFASKDIAAAPSANNAASVALPSGLAMVNGSLDGKTPEERAAEAAAAAAAAKAEADRKAKEEEDARKKAEEDAKKNAVPAVDPAAMAAAAGAGAGGAGAGAGGKGIGHGKFGALSSSLGGGHSGLAGGAGLSGGVGRAFAATGSSGKSNSFGKTAAPSRATAKAAATPRAMGKGRAFRQLVNANQRGQAARSSGGAEGAAQAADDGFTHNAGAGSAITGGGAGTGGAGAGDHAPSADPNSSKGPTGCTGDCSGGAANVGHTDSSPWKDEIETAGKLEIAAGIMLLVAGIFSKLSNAGGPWTQFFKIAAGILGGIAAIMGGVIAGLGASINGKGGPGTMHIVIGGAYVIGGAAVIVNVAAPEVANGTIIGTIGTWGAIFGGLIGAGMGLSSASSAGASSGKVPQNL